MNKTYKTVEGLMRGLGCSEQVVARFKQLREETKISTELTLMRLRVGMTPGEMGKALKMSAKEILALESGYDKDLTIGVIRGYARTTGIPIVVSI
jgi:hypothetical protein